MPAVTYQKPGFFTAHVVNPALTFLTGTLGVTMRGSRVLSVRGRKSGRWHSTPVNPLTFNGSRYLVAPRGETQWVRNLRASGEARLTRGRRSETIRVTEVPVGERPAILRAYLKRWARETNQFFGGVGAGASDDQLTAIAPHHPTFRIND